MAGELFTRPSVDEGAGGGAGRRGATLRPAAGRHPNRDRHRVAARRRPTDPARLLTSAAPPDPWSVACLPPGPIAAGGGLWSAPVGVGAAPRRRCPAGARAEAYRPGSCRGLIALCPAPGPPPWTPNHHNLGARKQLWRVSESMDSLTRHASMLGLVRVPGKGSGVESPWWSGGVA
ncbi:hypothetical protein FMEAI12_6730011 [Parafrankia sp. Ea1.12]|nr:hypothetical protein FMEAI12_6730011 [Parafrankia sp. Ea1.12]